VSAVSAVSTVSTVSTVSAKTTTSTWGATYLGLFNKCTHGPWRTSGKDVQWRLDSDNALYFQCSASPSDWKHNFLFCPKAVRAYKGSRWYAHEGFLLLWKSVQDEIMSALAGSTPSIVAGYSQGGALATLAHEDLHFRGIHPNTVTFGSPRVVWNPFRLNKEIDKRFLQVYNIAVQGDIVTKVPPAVFGYVTEGRTARIGPLSFPSAANHAKYREYLE